MKRKKTKITGTVYQRIYVGPKSSYYGQSYIGETIDIRDRNRKFFNPNNHNYGGEKIEKARNILGLDPKNWQTKTLHQITYSCTPATYEETKKKVKKEIQEIQTKAIIQNDTVRKGFNSSTSFGYAGVDIDEETRKRMGDSMRGKHHTPETRAKISAAGKGRIVKEETKAKISAGNKGKKRTPEQNAAESARLKGKEPKAATEGARKWRETHPGWWANHPVSDEMKANIKKAQQAIYPDYVAYDKAGQLIGTFKSMNEIKDKLGDAPGSVHNNLKINDTSHFTKNGYRYKII